MKNLLKSLIAGTFIISTLQGMEESNSALLSGVVSVDVRDEITEILDSGEKQSPEKKRARNVDKDPDYQDAETAQISPDDEEEQDEGLNRSQDYFQPIGRRKRARKLNDSQKIKNRVFEICRNANNPNLDELVMLLKQLSVAFPKTHRPLSIAARNNNLLVARRLLEHGAHPLENQEIDKDATPLGIATLRKQVEMITLFREYMELSPQTVWREEIPVLKAASSKKSGRQVRLSSSATDLSKSPPVLQATSNSSINQSNAQNALVPPMDLPPVVANHAAAAASSAAPRPEFRAPAPIAPVRSQVSAAPAPIAPAPAAPAPATLQNAQVSAPNIAVAQTNISAMAAAPAPGQQIAQSQDIPGFPAHSLYYFTLAAATGNMPAMNNSFERLASEDKKKEFANYRFNALHLATIRKQPDLIRYLLNNGALIDAADGCGRTALMHAIAMEALDIVQLLLERSANINAQDLDSFPVFCYNLRHKDSPTDDRIFKLLLNNPHLNLSIRGTFGETILHVALKYNKKNKASQLIKSGAPCDIQDNNGITPLMIAIEKGFYDVANELLDAGCRTDLQDNKGCAALHKSIEQRQIPIALKLMRKGAPLNVQNNDGYTPLILAAKNNLLTIVGALLGAKADTTVSVQGQTYHHFLSASTRAIREKSIINPQEKK